MYGAKVPLARFKLQRDIIPTKNGLADQSQVVLRLGDWRSHRDIMSGSLDRSFGLVIAFLLPGFTLVLGVAVLSPTVANWLSQEPTPNTGLGGFVYVVMSSLAAGMIASAVRWLVVDSLMHRLGLKPPVLNYSKLQANLEAFELAVHHNYRHYQFYANSFVSLWGFAACHQIAAGTWWPKAWIGFVALQAVLLVTARDCLRRYYDRIGEVIG